MLAVWLLAACTEPIAFSCCNDRGKVVYVDVADGPATGPEQRDVVLRAVRDGVIPAELDVDAVARVAARHARSPNFWKAIYANAASYAQVVGLAIEGGQEPIIAAYPLVISGYLLDAQADDCSRGAWQLGILDPRVQVGPCRLHDDANPWSRDQGDVASLTTNRCRIHHCEPDERDDLVASTRAVLASGPVPGDRNMAAGIHLLAVCVVPVLPARPAYCDRIEVPTRDQVDPPEKRR